MELDSRKNEVKEQFKRQDISVEVGFCSLFCHKY